MGAGQSTDDGQNSSSRSAPVKTGYYELLGVDRQATDDEIKKAYRRKALELHPDRNYGQVERTTALFAEVQSAYEVLSDPQERAWYDSHEDAILCDADPAFSGEGGSKYERNVGMTTADDITRIIGRFHGGVEFSDAPSGFFGFLRETFDNLAAEEHKAARQEDLDEIDYPSFGHRDDKHEDVVKTFYAAWSGFSTKKTFSWRDQYSTRGVADRRTRRIIEKENRRFRDEAIREFNDSVRTLVAFVKKRDPRYKPNTQSEAERQKALREATAAQAARQRAVNAARLEKEVIPEWAKVREPEELEESEEEESEEEQFECVACRKVFKSENQFEAHEKSKKHQKTVQALRRRMQKEGFELDLDGETDTSDQVEYNEDVVTELNSHETGGEEDDQKILNSMEHVRIEDSTDKMGHSKLATDYETEEDGEEAEEASNAHPPTHYTAVHEESSDDPASEATDTPSRTTEATESSIIKETEELNTEQQPKIGKAAQKRARKAAQRETAGDQAQHRCVSCNATFTSRTRLFDHIKDFGHAAPVPAAKRKGKNAKGK